MTLFKAGGRSKNHTCVESWVTDYLRDEVKDKWSELSIHRCVSNYSKIGNNIWSGPSIEPDMYAARIFLAYYWTKMSERRMMSSRKPYLQNLRNMFLSQLINLSDIPWDSCIWGDVYFWVQHLKHLLQRWVRDYSEGTMALGNPASNEISKMRLVVSWSTSEVCDGLLIRGTLSFTLLNMPYKITGGIVVPCTGSKLWRISIEK